MKNSLAFMTRNLIKFLLFLVCELSFLFFPRFSSFEARGKKKRNEAKEVLYAGREKD